MRRHSWLLAIAGVIAIGTFTDTGPLMLGSTNAEAVIGRPMTPVSYAGVARRTTRRTYRAGAYGYGAPVYHAPVVATGAVVTALPAGCANVMVDGAVVYQCAGVRYRPAYSGGALVYYRY